MSEKTLMDKNPEEALTDMTNYINNVMNGEVEESPTYGFVLLTFKFDTAPVSLMYVSNTQREGMINLLRHQADVLEQQKDDVLIGEEPNVKGD